MQVQQDYKCGHCGGRYFILYHCLRQSPLRTAAHVIPSLIQHPTDSRQKLRTPGFVREAAEGTDDWRQASNRQAVLLQSSHFVLPLYNGMVRFGNIPRRVSDLRRPLQDLVQHSQAFRDRVQQLISQDGHKWEEAADVRNLIRIGMYC